MGDSLNTCTCWRWRTSGNSPTLSTTQDIKLSIFSSVQWNKNKVVTTPTLQGLDVPIHSPQQPRHLSYVLFPIYRFYHELRPLNVASLPLHSLSDVGTAHSLLVTVSFQSPGQFVGSTPHMCGFLGLILGSCGNTTRLMRLCPGGSPW